MRCPEPKRSGLVWARGMGNFIKVMDVQPLLVVEDETLIRIDLVDMLERGGYTVDEAVNAAAGIAR